MGEERGRNLVYDSLLYGLGAAFGDLAKTSDGARLVEDLNRRIGAYIAEYLEKKGVKVYGGKTTEEVVGNVVRIFNEELGFGRIEQSEPTPDRGMKAVWRDLLGHAAYEELAKKYPDPFLSCPLNAVLRALLEPHGQTLVVHGCLSDYAQNLLISWEEVRQGTSFIEKPPQHDLKNE